MKALDRYILKKLFSSFLFTVLIIVSVVCIIDLTEKNEKYVRAGLSTMEILHYYMNFFPYVTNIIFPITVFIATVFVTSKLAAHTEIIAMLSSGMSFRRLIGTYMMGGVVFAIINFLMHAYIIPNSNKPRIAFEVQYLKRQHYFSERDVHMKVAENTYFYMESYNNHSNTAYNVSLETIVDNQLVDKLYAKQMVWVDSIKIWRLKNWNKRELNLKGLQSEYKYFDDGAKLIHQSLDTLNGIEMGDQYSEGKEMDTVLALSPDDFGSQYMLYESFTLSELREYIKELKNRGADDVVLYEIEEYLRYTYPFAVIILTFIGVTVSARKTRGGTGFQIALGFLLAFVLIIFFMFSRAIAEKGTMNPLLAVWIPNIVFGFIGLGLYRSLPR